MRAGARAVRLGLTLLLALPLVVVAVGQLGGFAGTPPSDLGLRDGRLEPPSSTANSVSSEAALHPGHPQSAAAQIDPLPLRGDAAASLARLHAVLSVQPGVRIVQTMQSAPGYLRAEARTRWLGFVDDLEFHADGAAGVIQLRSASRLGASDFGTNRARIEAIRAAYLAGT